MFTTFSVPWAEYSRWNTSTSSGGNVLGMTSFVVGKLQENDPKAPLHDSGEIILHLVNLYLEQKVTGPFATNELANEVTSLPASKVSLPIII